MSTETNNVLIPDTPVENNDTRSDGGENIILPFEKCDDVYVESLGEIPKKPFYSFVKRTFDIVLSLFCLIVLAVPMAIIAIIIKCTSRGPVFYHQERLGKDGKKISIIKFRTMDTDAEEGGMKWSEGDDDPRIHRFGRILRKTRLDELPQCWCILKNDMSFVGPRPERECFHNVFESYIHGFGERLKVKPGLTGLAQVNGGYDLRPEEKIIYDVEYIKKRSILFDLKIMFMTVAVVFTHRGAK